MKTVLTTTFALLALFIVGVLAFVYSGIYNVAATSQDSALVRWLLHTTMERSVESRSEHIKPPADIKLGDPETIRIGFRHYDEMCIVCHGAPGIEPGEAHDGLNPRPPSLAKHAREMAPGELFWVIKHGVKMTGMPAWGPTHSDEKIWAMVAFLKTMPDMTAAEYRSLRAAADKSSGGDHDHGTGGDTTDAHHH